MKIFINVILAVTALLFATACASSGGSSAMSDAEYLRASPAKQADYLQTVAGNSSVLDKKRVAEFKAGQPIRVGDKKTGYTVQCQRFPGQSNLTTVGFYPGHNPPGWSGSVTEAFAVFAADSNCAIRTTSGPHGEVGINTVLANVATSQDVRLQLATLGASMVTPVVTQLIANEGVCDDNCGMQLSLNNGASASSDSTAITETTTDVTVGVEMCGNAPCSAVPRGH